MNEPDFYAVLGVSPDAEPEVIQAAYRALARKYHPDTSGGNSSENVGKFRLIVEVYAVLSDQDMKRAYDQRRAEQHSQPSRAARPEKQTLPALYSFREIDWGIGNLLVGFGILFVAIWLIGNAKLFG